LVASILTLEIVTCAFAIGNGVGDYPPLSTRSPRSGRHRQHKGRDDLNRSADPNRKRDDTHDTNP
jgi:hypothetical protein